MLRMLQQAVQEGALRLLDLHFARFIAGSEQPLLALIVACLSAAAGRGDVCLPLSLLTAERLFPERHAELVERLWCCAGEPTLADCLTVLQNSAAVSDGSRPTPLVLYQQKLYLQRFWQDEERVADFFRQTVNQEVVDALSIRHILETLFPVQVSTECDWQKVAAAVAVTHRCAVISGGPGTGKTTTVAKLLLALIRLQPTATLRIQLAAPTGKAAARLTESLASALQQLSLTEQEIAQFPQAAVTLHRLLGVLANSPYSRYHQDNPLHLDLLVVDEASMVDLPMMAKLIAALPTRARLILLGDKDQLASVEAGAVLGDLCHFAKRGYGEKRAEELTYLTGYSIPAGEHEEQGVEGSLCLLRKSYRFAAQSGIGQLATAVNKGDAKAALDCFNRGYHDIAYHQIDGQRQQLIATAVDGYRFYLQQLQQQRDQEVILNSFSHFQLLCALRHGPYGVSGLNEDIEQALHQAKLIRYGSYGRHWYLGRPVMIERNEPALDLFNGDIGIALLSPQGALRVYFLLPDGTVKSVSPNRLPEHKTAYAMTIHKSQGSEFDHVLCVLPEQDSQLLTRELIYTAVTRARQHLTLYAPQQVLTSAIKRITERHSGLVERLTEKVTS